MVVERTDIPMARKKKRKKRGKDEAAAAAAAAVAAAAAAAPSIASALGQLVVVSDAQHRLWPARLMRLRSHLHCDVQVRSPLVV